MTGGGGRRRRGKALLTRLSFTFFSELFQSRDMARGAVTRRNARPSVTRRYIEAIPVFRLSHHMKEHDHD